jgi:hypothetical protein
MTGTPTPKNVDELYKDGQRHISLVMLRGLLSIPLAMALSTAHEKWGQPYPGDGQQAFGFIVIFGMIGIAVTASYFALGCLVQYLLRKRVALWTIGFDVTVALILGGLLVHMGMTAKYVDAGTAPKVLRNTKNACRNVS